MNTGQKKVRINSDAVPTIHSTATTHSTASVQEADHLHQPRPGPSTPVTPVASQRLRPLMMLSPSEDVTSQCSPPKKIRRATPKGRQQGTQDTLLTLLDQKPQQLDVKSVPPEADKKFIVFQSNLLELFETCNKCGRRTSGAISYTNGSLSNEVPNSHHMEKEGLVRSVTFLKEHDIKIKALVTDGHKMIAKWVRENMPETTHNLDVWHVSKGIKKKLLKLSVEKDCTDLQPWIRSLTNHLYWTAATSQGLENEVIMARWGSVLNHIINIHTGHSAVFVSCVHGENKGVREITGNPYEHPDQEEHTYAFSTPADFITGGISFCDQPFRPKNDKFFLSRNDFQVY
ncbi:hypothetical protein ScPMuIL_006137 [Solemya velum]